MNKRLLLKVFVLCLLLCQLVNRAQAQYAVGGEAGVNAKNVYWLTFPPPGTLNFTPPVGYLYNKIVNGVYEWKYSNTVTIRATVSNLTFLVVPNRNAGVPTTQMVTYTSGLYTGDGFDVLYNGNGQTAKDGNNSNNAASNSRGVTDAGMRTMEGGEVKFDIRIELLMKINGVEVPIAYPGMLIADAESLDYPNATNAEYIQGTTNAVDLNSGQPIGWQLINLRKDPAKSGFWQYYRLTLANNRRDFKLMLNNTLGANPGIQAVLYAHGAQEITNLNLRGNGRTAIATGFIFPFDLGDGPTTYGRPESYINDFTFNAASLADGVDQQVDQMTLATLTPSSKVYLGTNNVDADGNNAGSSLANTDDAVSATSVNDETSVNAGAISIKVNQAGDIVVPFTSVTNTYPGTAATIYGWIDFNRDGKFQATERATTNIPANTIGDINKNITFVNDANFKTNVKAGSTIARFRITTSTLTDHAGGTTEDDASTSSSADGEIEDYAINISGVTISGNVYNDANGVTGGITGSAITAFTQYAYLTTTTTTPTILQKTTVSGAGTYSFTGVDNGAYRVIISNSNTPVVGALASSIPTTITGWTPSADGYGTNNAANTLSAVDDGTPNYQVAVTITSNGQDVTDVNFGIDQNPVAVADGPVAANTNTATTADVTANDTDPDGNATINKGSVFIETAPLSGSFTQSAVSVTNVGDFTVNGTTGVITFTSTGEFVGDATIRYTVKDNFGAVSDPVTVTFRVKIGGVADPIETTVNSGISYNVKANDGTAATTGVVIVTPQAGLTPNGGNAITDPQDATKVLYTPANNFVGIDTYTYTLTKNSVTSDPITVTVTVKPRGADDNDSTTPGVPKNTVVTTNDNGGTGSTISIVSGPATGQGTITLNGNGTSIDYDPGTFTGVTTYKYKITSPSALTSGDITVTMSVKPTGVTDTYNILAGAASPVANPVLVNDNPGTGATIAITTAVPSGKGTATVNGTSIDYAPGAFTGSTTYKYRITSADGLQTSDEITVNINVKPTGVTDTYNILAGAASPVANPVLVNDNPGTGATIAITTAVPSGKGTATVNGTSIDYAPGAFTGSTTYKYRITSADGLQTSDEITVNINVKPTGVTDTYNILAGAASPVANPVLVNDNPGTGATIAITTAVPSGKGTATVNGTSIDYAPGAFTGSTTYKYRITSADGLQTSDEITVNINVKPTGVTDTYNILAGTASPVANPVLVNDNPGTGATIAITTAVPSGKGTATVNGTSIDYAPGAFTGSTTYKYRITSADGLQTSDEITVNINVVETLLVGVDDIDYVPGYKIGETPTSVTTSVTTNDGADGSGATITAGNGSNGTTTVTGNAVTYAPNANFVGTDTYKYRLHKGSGVSNDITVTIHVSAITLKKEITNTSAVHSTGEVINYKLTVKNVGPVVLTNVVITDAGADAGSILPSPNIASLAPGAEAIVTAKHTVTTTDVAAGKYANQATVTAKDPKNPTPNDITSKSDDPITTTPNDPTEVTITPLPASISIAKAGVQSGNNINYTFTITNTGTVNLTNVTITDTKLGLNAVAVTLTNGVLLPGASVTHNAVYAITPTDKSTGSVSNTVTVNAKDPGNNNITNTGSTITTVLLGVDDNDLTPVNTPVTTNVIGNDGTSGTSAVVIATAGSHGTTTVSNGNVTYTPANSYIGTDTYTYTLTKGGGTSAPITVTINVYSATMSLSKVANNGATKAGDVINYTLILKNTGTVALTNIVITDGGADAGSISPASIASLAPGAFATITANHTVVPTDVSAGKFTNQATATAKDPKNNTISKISDDPSTTTFDDPTVVPIIPLVPASINLAKTGVFAGNQVSYTFIITNNGGVPLNTITLTDAKLGLNGVAIASPSGGLLPNQSLTYNATYTLTQADKDLGAVNNTATVNAKDPGNNTVTGTGSTVTTVTTSPVATNDAAETKSGIPVIVSVLTNDNPKNSTFNLTSIEIVGSPMHGTVVANADGTITYTPIATYVGTDSFTYRVKDAYGYYTNVATVSITINEFKDLKIPSLFSPNGDGVNDGFIIKDLGDYAQNELIVINRWGNEVYRQADYKNNWSGTGLNEGTYFYIVRLKKSNGDSWVIRKGYVTLIRTFKK